MKISESIIHDQLYDYLHSNSILHPAQSGFRPKHCTQDVLLKSVDDWRRALDHGEMVGTMMLDLSKAFDSVDHIILLSKLEAMELEMLNADGFTAISLIDSREWCMAALHATGQPCAMEFHKDPYLVHCCSLCLSMTSRLLPSIAP